MFVKILTAHDKYSLLNRHNLRQPIQMQLSQKKKAFSPFVAAFLKARLNLNIFNKNMTLIADVFLKLRTLKFVAK